jgi:hypothetical protein
MALTSEEIDALCDELAHGDQERYVRDMTAAAIDALQRAADGEGGTMAAEAALEKLAREFPAEARRILAEYSDVVPDQVRDAVLSALEGSAAADMAALASVYGAKRAREADKRLKGATLHFHRLSAAVAEGVASIVRRDNVSMEAVAERAWYDAASEAVQAVALGTMPREEAVARAAAKLAGKVGKVRYDSGEEAGVDVALRRHVVTQAAQAGGRLTMEAMRAYGHRLVITDAHFGARPSHAVWQGRPACMDGPATVDGVKYPGLVELTGYGTKQGLHGVNCKHSLNPYYPGITELPDRSFAAEREHFGMSSEEYYEATQRQRAMERAIRATKRQIAAMEQAGAGLESPAYVQKRLVLGRQQKRLRDWCAAKNLQRMPEREKAYGVAKQPRALTGDKWKPQARMRSKAAGPVKWSNPEIERLSTPEEVADRLMAKHGIQASDSFKALPLDLQKGAAAGVERAVEKYGKADVRYIKSEKMKKNEGSYDPMVDAITIAPDTTDAYITGFHEAAHAIDAERSSHMKDFLKTQGNDAYCLFSLSALKSARRALGVRVNSAKYKDLVIEMAGAKMYNWIIGKPEEIVMLALEREEAGKTTALSAAIEKEFGNAKANSR